ncbi:MAG: glycosyltransferase family 1 protein [Candidatus Sedimenticola sp. (ex Thyasira tokunagai)]
MKIYFDNIIFSLQRVGGISNYWSRLISALNITKHRVTFFESFNENIFKANLDIETECEFSLRASLLRYMPLLKRLPSKSLFHSSYYRVSLQSSVANITTIHDFTYEYYVTGVRRYVHSIQKKFSIKRSDGVICVSENTKNDLIKFYPKIDKSMVRVIYNGVGNEFKVVSDIELLNKYGVPPTKDYILFVGGRSGYKNFDIAVEVLIELPEYAFVIVGGGEPDPKESEMLSALDGRVYQLTGLSSADLNIIYNHAFCLLYPSAYEGFGIPVVEAMKSGCPVVSTNLSSIPEVVGDAALLVDNPCVNSFIGKIKMLEDVQVKESLISKGLERSKNYSWDKCCRETLAFYDEVWNKKFCANFKS